MYKYRVYTEDVNYADTRNLAAEFFEGYTIIKSEGYWKGKREDSIVFEIITEGQIDSQVDLFVYRLKQDNNQEAVLMTREVIEGGLK